jgi:RNA polymerase sigma-70 factor (ECF subfamily)
MAAETDEDIALAVQNGTTELFGTLVKRYEAKIARYAKKFLFTFTNAEDIVQDVFVKAYINIRSFDPKRRFSPWLYRIAHNEFINAIKKKGSERLTFFDSDTLFPHPVYEDPDESRHERDKIKKILDACIQELDPKYREPLILYYYEDVEYQEIADILQIPVSTVGVRLKRGRERLKTIFKKLHPHLELP